MTPAQFGRSYSALGSAFWSAAGPDSAGFQWSPQSDDAAAILTSDPVHQIEQALVAASLLLLAAILASKASSRFGVPALALFLLIGMFAGSEGPVGIPYDDPFSAQFLGVVALAVILFAGGLGTEAASLRPVLKQGISLATIGVLVTALSVGIFASFVLGFSFLEGLLLGSIVSSTDAAAVFSVLRSQRIGLKGRTDSLLELESGSNDPMAVFLTTALLGLLADPGASVWRMVPVFFLQMGVGALAGIACGRVTVWVLNRLKLESEGLYPVAALGAALLTYGGTALIGGSGFLAVYLAGIVVGNRDFIHKRSIVRFHDGLAWLLQIAMFLVLGLLVFPSRLLPVAGTALAITGFLIVVARPAAVFLGLSLARMRFRQKLFISWVGLRGAVPIVLATFPYLARLPRADLYFNVVFFIVLVSVLVQGTTVAPVARLLRLDRVLPARRRYPVEYVPGVRAGSELAEFHVTPSSPAAGVRIMDLHFPRTALIVLVGRGDDSIPPHGSTVIEPGDSLLVLCDRGELPAIRKLVGSEEQVRDG